MSYLTILQSSEFLSSLAGAFVGALAAFVLNAFHEIKKERDSKHDAIIRAQFTLASQAQTLRSLLTQHFEKFRTDPSRERMIPMVWHSLPDYVLELKEISFLASGPKPDVLNEILLAQACYHTTIKSLNMRNEVLQTLGNSSRIAGANMQTAVVSFEIGEQGILTVMMLKQITDSVYSSIDDALPKLTAAIEALEVVGKEMLFERNFLRFKWILPAKSPHAV